MIRENEQACLASVDDREDALVDLSRRIWEYAEPGLKEVESSRASLISSVTRDSGYSLAWGNCQRLSVRSMVRAAQSLPI